jgi:predicted TIM-barrel fold metal-dependent hydrolase
MRLVAFVLVLAIVPLQAWAQERLPIIDMHLHARAADAYGPPPVAICVPLLPHIPPHDPKREWGEVWAALGKTPPCPYPLWSPSTDEALMKQTIAILERRNVIGVVDGTSERVRQWSEAAPGRFIPGLMFTLGDGVVSPDSLRRLVATGAVKVLAEVGNQYAGIPPDDVRMEPYWALAEELDIPVGIHVGEGVPGAPYFARPRYRARLTSPFALEEVLIRHPKLRVYVMHYGSPLIDEMIAVLQTHPQLYVDIGGNQWLYPRPYFYDQLKRLIDAGFGKRVMFGSDQMAWPSVIESAIAIIEEAPFLGTEQKRDIFYNNAARFLRLSEKEIAKHHGR